VAKVAFITLLNFRSIPCQLHVLPIINSYIFGLFRPSYTFCQSQTLKFSVYSVPAKRSADYKPLHFRSLPFQLHVLPIINSYIFGLPATRSANHKLLNFPSSVPATRSANHKLKFSVYSMPATRPAKHKLLSFRSIPYRLQVLPNKLLNFRSIPRQLHVLPNKNSYIFGLIHPSYRFCQS